MARESTIPAAEKACRIRQASRNSIEGATIATVVAQMKTAKQPSITGRRPNRSDAGPITNCSTAVAAR